MQVKPYVGRLPLWIDVVLLRHRSHRISETARRKFPTLVGLLNRITSIEFKAPTGALEKGDLDQFFACPHHDRSQQRTTPRRRDGKPIAVAPQVTIAFQNNLRRSDAALREHAPGLHFLEASSFPPGCWNPIAWRDWASRL